MKRVTINEKTYNKLFNESRGVPNKAIDDAKEIVNSFIENMDEMYDQAVELETMSSSEDEDDEEDSWFYDNNDWEDDFSYDFYCGGWNNEYHVEVFFDSNNRLKADTDTDGEITINFSPIKRIIDKAVKTHQEVGDAMDLSYYTKNEVMNYLYPIILHELTHDTDEEGSSNDHIWLGSYHRLNEEDLREILYVFSDQEMNARISSSYALMERLLEEYLIDPKELSTYDSRDISNLVYQIIMGDEDELRIDNMQTLLNFIGRHAFDGFSYRGLIQYAEKENRRPYSLAYDLFNNDSRLKKNRNLKRLFYQNYKAAVRQVYYFYKKLFDRYINKITRTCYKAVQDYMERET